MSIGSLGSAGEQFRDFLGGSQRDVSRGLQEVLSVYGNPSGNFNRLSDRSRGLFQLSNSEYTNVYNTDSQNSYAETWYQEYRAVLSLRAEALKKKLNRAYTQVLERSMYAPVRPADKWVPNANRDMNDISAQDPLKLPGTGVVGDPVIPSGTKEDNTLYAHPDWFSGTGSKSTGEPYQDIRRYLNLKYPLPPNANDLDGDGGGWTFNDGTRTYTSNDDTTPNSKYYDLWAANSTGLFGGSPSPMPGGYNINTNSYWDNGWGKEVAQYMNVPPSTTTNNFVLNDPAGNNYFAEIPEGLEASSAQIRTLLPPSLVGSAADGYALPAAPGGTQVRTRVYGWKNNSTNAMDTGNTTGSAPTSPGGWTQYVMVTSGTRIYDPRGNVSQNLFTGGSSYTGPANAVISGITLNPQLAFPPPPAVLDNPADGLSDSLVEADLVDNTAIPIYQSDFVDSWLEARVLQKREAQVEAGYQAYVDGSAALANSGNPQANSMQYAEIMDNVFSALDTLGGATSGISGGGASVGPSSPQTGGSNPVSFPSSMPSQSSSLDLSSTIPYGHHIIPEGGGVYRISGSVNDIYEHGRDYGGVNSGDGGSIYGLIYQRLSFAAQNPFSSPALSSGSGAPSGTTVTYPPPPTVGAPGVYGVAGGTNNLYTAIPVGAAENPNASQPDINNATGVGNLKDTLQSIPSQAITVDQISKLFVGRQWDYVPGFNEETDSIDINAGAVKYKADTVSAHLMALPGWYGGITDNTPGSPLLTLSPPIEGFALQTGASKANWGKIDDVVNIALGGSFLRVGGGSDSSGFPDIGGPTQYNIAIGFGMGTLGIFWGHTSAIGKIEDIEYLYSEPQGPGPAFDLLTASLQVLSTVGSADPGEISVFPNVGLFGTNMDFNIPIPIPIPFVGLYFLNIPMTTYGGMSWDVMTDYMHQFLNGLKHEVLDSVSAYSYATSGGTAIDSYGMRGEYHFTEKSAFGAMKDMQIGPLNFGSAIQTMTSSILGASSGDTLNQANMKERMLERRHSVQAGEARELETGGFFSTAAFLSQFNLSQMNYSYWTGSHQNEEIANMDMMRALLVSGKELMKLMHSAIYAAAGQLDNIGPVGQATKLTLSFFLTKMNDSVDDALMWDLLFHDQSQSGFVTSAKIMSSQLQSEGYDFIEDERKIFQNDYQVTASAGVIGNVMNFALGSFEVPNTILKGMGNTRRYKPYKTGVDVRAGRQGWAAARAGDSDRVGRGDFDNNRTTSGDNIDYDTDNSGQRDRVNPLLFDKEGFDENWNIHTGFWKDTGLGDINEVYVRRNRVSWSGDITGGMGNNTANTRTVDTIVDRYVGSNNRIMGRAYDGGTPLNLQEFRYGYFAQKYFGSYIEDFEDGVRDNKKTISIQNLDADSDGNSVLNLHGGQGYVKRTNMYDMQFKFISGTSAISLSGKQALTPTLGGNIKMATVDKNVDYGGRMGYDVMGRDNPLNAVLTDYLRVREDGSNAQLVREYRDVFNLDLLDDIFISASANAPTGGGLTSSIRLKFHGYESESTDRATAVNLGLNTSFESTRNAQVAGTGTLTVDPGYLGRRTYFKNASRGKIDIFLNSFFAFKRPPRTS